MHLLAFPSPAPHLHLHCYYLMETGMNCVEIDTSRPFQSVREAVEVFGERFPVTISHSSCDPNAKLSVPSAEMLECLKKLGEDLAEAKHELVQLKERQSQMEIAVSSLSVQCSNGLSVLSDLKKGKQIDISASIVAEEGGAVRSDRWDESRAEEWMASLEYLPSLSEALTIKMIEDELGERTERKVNKKPQQKQKQQKQKQRKGIPLVVGMFSRKNKSS